MSPAETLPPELWLIIFEMVLETDSVADHCDHLKLPDVLDHVRNPWKYSPLGSPFIRNSQLVCRKWYLLLKAVPYVVLNKHDSPVPTGTTAVYIYPSRNSKKCLYRLLSQPERSHQITTLDLPGPEHLRSRVPMIFDFFCENAVSFPNIRNLTLGLDYFNTIGSGAPCFWTRLNNAFFHLTCLVLRGCLTSTEYPPEGPVIFQKLQLLDYDRVDPHPNVYFPVLKHVAFDSTHAFTSGYFNNRARLESLILRDRHSTLQKLYWDTMPHLRLLGITSETVDCLTPLPPHHPLQHLYVYAGTILSIPSDRPADRKTRELRWMKQIIKLMPTVERITLACQHSEDRPNSIQGDFDQRDLIRMGFKRSYSSEVGRKVILQRSSAPLQPFTDAFMVKNTSQMMGARADSKKFLSFTPRIIHP